MGPEILSIGSNLKKLMDFSGDWIDKMHQQKPPKRLILDMDSSVSDLERAMLWRGNHTSATDRLAGKPIGL